METIGKYRWTQYLIALFNTECDDVVSQTLVDILHFEGLEQLERKGNQMMEVAVYESGNL